VVPGAYGFPVDRAHVPIDDQVDALLDTMGLLKGKLLMLDYEPYGLRPAATITPNGLKSYIRTLRERIGDHPVIVYSGKNFWEEPDSGLLDDYGKNLHLWGAWYWSMDAVPNPRSSTARASSGRTRATGPASVAAVRCSASSASAWPAARPWT